MKKTMIDPDLWRFSEDPRPTYERDSPYGDCGGPLVWRWERRRSGQWSPRHDHELLAAMDTGGKSPPPTEALYGDILEAMVATEEANEEIEMELYGGGGASETSSSHGSDPR